jgi:hypothetical protein
MLNGQSYLLKIGAANTRRIDMNLRKMGFKKAKLPDTGMHKREGAFKIMIVPQYMQVRCVVMVYQIAQFSVDPKMTEKKFNRKLLDAKIAIRKALGK